MKYKYFIFYLLASNGGHVDHAGRTIINTDKPIKSEKDIEEIELSIAGKHGALRAIIADWKELPGETT